MVPHHTQESDDCTDPWTQCQPILHTNKNHVKNWIVIKHKQSVCNGYNEQPHSLAYVGNDWELMSLSWD